MAKSGLNMKKLKKKLREVKEKTESGPFWWPKDGDSKIRILPPVGKMDSDEFFVEGGIHYNVGPNKDNVICRDTDGTDGSRCPVCQAVSDLMSSGESSDVNLGKSMRRKTRYYVNIIDMAEPKKGPQVFPMNVSIFKGVLSFITDPDYGDMTDLKEGRDITITRTGKGIDTSYEVRPRPKTSEVKKSVLKNAEDLSTWSKLVPPEEEELLNLLGLADDDEDEEDVDTSEEDEEEDEDEEEEEDEEPDEEEEEDEEDSDEEEDDDTESEDGDEDDGDEDEEEEDDDDDEDDDEEDEDEEDEDEEEEEAPRRRKKKSKKNAAKAGKKKSAKGKVKSKKKRK